MKIDQNSTILDVVQTAVSASDMFEQLGRTKNGFEIKKIYIQQNYDKYREIGRRCKHSVAMFTTGYPGYDLKLAEINEQYRYNHELLSQVNDRKIGSLTWKCGGCLMENYHKMPNLKMVCYPCTKIASEVKPRKILNRLPDLDVWYVYDDSSVSFANDNTVIEGNRTSLMKEIPAEVARQKLATSDVNPVKSINDMYEVAMSLKNDRIPSQGLPVDVHIVGYNYLINLIKSVPEYMYNNLVDNTFELKINPYSLRKKWDFDEEGYNFVFDFLMSFTVVPYSKSSSTQQSAKEKELENIVNETRKIITSKFTDEEIFSILYNVAGASARRRIDAKCLTDELYQKFANWKNGKFEKGNWILQSPDSSALQKI